MCLQSGGKSQIFPLCHCTLPVSPLPGGEERQEACRACSVLAAPSSSLGTLPPPGCEVFRCHLLCGPAWLLSEVTSSEVSAGQGQGLCLWVCFLASPVHLKQVSHYVQAHRESCCSNFSLFLNAVFSPYL